MRCAFNTAVSQGLLGRVSTLMGDQWYLLGEFWPLNFVYKIYIWFYPTPKSFAYSSYSAIKNKQQQKQQQNKPNLKLQKVWV